MGRYFWQGSALNETNIARGLREIERELGAMGGELADMQAAIYRRLVVREENKKAGLSEGMTPEEMQASAAHYAALIELNVTLGMTAHALNEAVTKMHTNDAVRQRVNRRNGYTL